MVLLLTVLSAANVTDIRQGATMHRHKQCHQCRVNDGDKVFDFDAGHGLNISDGNTVQKTIYYCVTPQLHNADSQQQ